ncbi:MAG: outer membrane lipoprotein-sorting protein [Bacteroidetes bacterium]|nr:outer membrane lipoprotein-sorting protein [Bacteroidota bacterium]MBU1719630.1 outer membrane lipoprotein-sorting protein [Bacteroidota bacterium]
MKTLIKSFGILTLILITSMADAQDAKEIIKKSDEKARGETSVSEMNMTIQRPGWSRTVGIKSWSLGTGYFMILITSPAKEEGQAFLKIGNEMWNWIPSIERLVKIPPSMMLQSWMGSDFTNDDLVKQSSIVEDYTHKLLGKETVRGKECYRIELIPKEDAAVVWGKVIVWITTDGYDQWKVEFYDEDNELVSEQNASDLKKMGDRTIPTKMEMLLTNKPGNKTIIEITMSDFNTPIEKSFFSQQNMKKLRK